MGSAAPPKLSLAVRDLGGFRGPLRSCSAPPPPPLPCPHPVPPCCGWHPPAPGSVPRPVPAPCCEPPGGVPLLWPLSPLGSPLLCAGPPEDLRWGKAAAWRESTGALRAWLGQHLRSPYPSKGEKVVLALLSRRTVSQVSTWFANARRRLKKENQLRVGPRLLVAPGEVEEEEEEEEEDKKGQAAGGSPQSKTPWGSSRAADPWWGPGQNPAPLASTGQAVPERGPLEPRLWSMAQPAPRLLPWKPPQWVWGPRPLRTLRESPSCAPREGRAEGPPPGPHEEPSGARRGIALPSPGWCALEVVDYSPQDAQLACQLVVQAYGSAHRERTRPGKAGAGAGRGRATGALLQAGTEGSYPVGGTARRSNPLAQWVERE